MSLDSRSPAATPSSEDVELDAAWRTVVLATAVSCFVRLLLAATIPPFPDEAYYWDWSRRLAAGYFDHPPAVAWLIAIGTSALGATPLGIRLGTLLCALAMTVATVGTTARLGGARAASRAALLLACMPLATLGLFLATTDAPALCAVSIALYCLTRALETPAAARGTLAGGGLAWWAGAGGALGAGLLSRLTVGLVAVALALAFLARPSLRARLRSRGPWLAVALSIVVSAPVWWWNARHGWIEVRFQLAHGLGAPARGTALGRELALLGGQVALVSPLVAVAMALAIAGALRDAGDRAAHEAPVRDAAFVLGVVALGVLLFFAWSALRRPVEPNWPALAYVAAIPLAACAATRWTRRWLVPACALGAACIVAILAQSVRPLVHLAPRRDPIARAYGWDQLAARVDAVHAASAHEGHAVWLAADRYEDAAELALHGAGTPRVFALNLGGRPNQYDLWPAFADAARSGDALVLAVDASGGGDDVARRLAPYFASATAVERVALMHDGDTVAARLLWSFRGWRGGWPRRTAPVTVAGLPRR